MPESFVRNYPRTRAIFDCFEVATEVPSKVSHNVLAWSNYIKRFTIKVLLALAPCCLIQFVSKGYGGRATDSQIVVSSGVLLLSKSDTQNSAMPNIADLTSSSFHSVKMQFWSQLS